MGGKGSVFGCRRYLLRNEKQGWERGKHGGDSSDWREPARSSGWIKHIIEGATGKVQWLGLKG